MDTKPLFEAALSAAAMSDLHHKGNRAKVEASDRVAAPATVGRA
jgi:hypothetical protein